MQYSAAIGDFDGFHKGHLSVIRELILISRRSNTVPMVITFRNDPNSSRRLLTDDEKESILKSMGVKVLFVDYPRIRRMTGSEFFGYIGKTIKLRNILVGNEFRFGYRRSEGRKEMAAICSCLGIVLHGISQLMAGGLKVSSSRIRKLIAAGSIRSANKLLSFPYSVSGAVTRGLGLGSRLGYPTINILVADEKIVPEGVFKGLASVPGPPGGREYNCLAVAGNRLGGKKRRKNIVEIYIPSARLRIRTGSRLRLIFLEEAGRIGRYDTAGPLAENIGRQVKKHSKFLYKTDNKKYNL